MVWFLFALKKSLLKLIHSKSWISLYILFIWYLGNWDRLISCIWFFGCYHLCALFKFRFNSLRFALCVNRYFNCPFNKTTQFTLLFKPFLSLIQIIQCYFRRVTCLEVLKELCYFFELSIFLFYILFGFFVWLVVELTYLITVTAIFFELQC